MRQLCLKDRLGRAVWVVAAVALCATTTGMADEPADGRADVPDAAEVARTVQQIKVVYAKEYARRAPDDRHALVKLLMREANDRGRKPIERYAMLSEAKAIALQIGRPWTAYTAVNDMEARFRIDALPIKADIVTTTARTVRDARGAESVLRVGFTLLDRYVAEDRYDEATTIVSQLRPAAAKANDPSLVDRVNAFTRQIASLRAAYRRLQGQLQTLISTPDDPAALEAVGRFYALAKGDWERGLPMLAGGKDPVLAALAKRDLAGPTDPEAMLALADEYWKLSIANGASDAGLYYRNRAGHWYRQVLPKLTGVARDAAAKRAASADAVAWGGMSFEPGLTGIYYASHDRTAAKMRRVDQAIDFDWGVGRPTKKLPPDRFMIEWTGWLRPTEEGLYTIRIESRGLSELTIDGRLVLSAANGATTVYLTKAFVPITLTYRKWRGDARVKLHWTRPGGEAFEPIGRDALFHRLVEPASDGH